MERIDYPLVEVEFLDHCMNEGLEVEPIFCRAIGMVLVRNKDYITLATWISNEELDNNLESFTIMADEIISIRELVRGPNVIKGKKSKYKKGQHSNKTSSVGASQKDCHNGRTVQSLKSISRRTRRTSN